MSGGQTGADRAALDTAIAHGIDYGGWCPAGGWAEDFPEPPGLLTRYPGLHEAASADPAVRTRLNVIDSDATLIVRAPDAVSPGSDLTWRIAQQMGRPALVTEADAAAVVAWLSGLGTGITLNVAGPRESGQPGSYQATVRLLERVLADVEGPIR